MNTARKRPLSARREARLGVVLILPATLALTVVMIVPLIAAGYASFFDYKLGQESNMVFVFLDNYIRFFRDPVAIQSLVNTIIFTVLSVGLSLILGIGVSVLLASFATRTGNFFRAIFTMPLLVSPIIVALIWRYMYDPQFGIVYWFLGLFGLESAFGGLSQPGSALLSVVIADVWNVTPFVILVVSAGLTVIPEEIYEAARLDGAGTLRNLFSITIPLMSKVLAVVILIRGTEAFRVFDIIYGLTNGGPANSTSSLSIYAYKAAYQNNEMGYAMAVSIITVLALLLLFSPLVRNSARNKDG